MAEKKQRMTDHQVLVRHRGRIAQIPIYLGKQLRMFVYQSDWKVIPMSALIAGLVGMVIRKRMFINMEGSLMGAFALACVGIWNGCFNSIQVICRERDVIKRMHRSGMHITSYVFAHMVYQAMLCLLQTLITLHVTRITGIQYPAEGLFTRWFLVDFGISMFLITYASDMMALWISTIAKNSTTAMTIMPFVLIFQLVFSGGMLALPEWSKPLTMLTVSNPGLKVIAAQTDYNHKPVVTVWNAIKKMKDSEIGGTITVGDVLDKLSDTKNKNVRALREIEIGNVLADAEQAAGEMELAEALELVGALESAGVLESAEALELAEALESAEALELVGALESAGAATEANTMQTEGTAATEANTMQAEETAATEADTVQAEGTAVKTADSSPAAVSGSVTIGDLIDLARNSEEMAEFRNQGITLKTTVGKLIDFVGKKAVKKTLQEKLAAGSYNPDYEYTKPNIMIYWSRLLLFVILFAALATITLEFIDKDKR